MNLIPIFVILIAHARCQTLESILEGANRMASENILSRKPRNSDQESLIWEEFEFGTGVGNREELVVSNISVFTHQTLPHSISNWQFLAIANREYLVGSTKSTLYLYGFSTQQMTVRTRLEFPIAGEILTFKLLSSSDFESASDESTTGVPVVIVCVAVNYTAILEWYKFVESNSTLRNFWSWPIQKPMKRIESIRHGNANKLVFLSEANNYARNLYSFVYVYGFAIDLQQDWHDIWLCQSFTVARTDELQLCPFQESTIFTIRGRNNIYMYQYQADYATNEGSFKFLHNVTSNNLRNSVCFESGYLQYLAISGPEAAIFNFYENEFQYDPEAENLFNDITEISWIREVPVDTYRKESLLLVQSTNFTTMALAWQGLEFKRIKLPNDLINDFDLSRITVIPKFGFVSGNRFVRLETWLRNLARPIHDETEKLLQVKALFEEVLIKQQEVLDETEARFNASYLRNPVITGFWNVTEIRAKNATISDTMRNMSVSIGSRNTTLQQLEESVKGTLDTLNHLEAKIGKIESLLKTALPKNSSDVKLEHDLYVTGDLSVPGKLTTGSLSLLKLNGFPVNQSVNDHAEDGKSVTIEGRKSFPTVKSPNLRISRINGIPIERFVFSEKVHDYGDVNFGKVENLVINGSLDFSSVNGIDWQGLMRKVVPVNSSNGILIPGNTIIEGNFSADGVIVDNINGVVYPNYYISRNSKDKVQVTGEKTFDTLTVSTLIGVNTINGIDIHDFVLLKGEQTLPEEITFERLTVQVRFQNDGVIIGGPKAPATCEANLRNSKNITCDVLFSTLHVEGNIVMGESVNGTSWEDMDDLVLRSEENVTITGTKEFLDEVFVDTRLVINSRRINGHQLDEFVTLDTPQTFPNLKKISANVTFGDVEIGDLRKLEADIEAIYAKLPVNCTNRTIIFEEAPIFDTLHFNSLNEKTSGIEFRRKWDEFLTNVRFQNLTTENLLTDEMLPVSMNGIDFADFENRRLTPSTPQNITGKILIRRLETPVLNAVKINGIPVTEIEQLRADLETQHFRIFSGSQLVDSVTVLGNLAVDRINGKSVGDIYRPDDDMGAVVFEDDVFIGNLTVSGFINGYNFTEYLRDAVFKSDQSIEVTGHKRFRNISCESLDTSYFNEHSVESLLDPQKEQVLTGPVVVKGTTTVLQEFSSSGKIGAVPYENITRRFRVLEDGSLDLEGDFRFGDDVTIESLEIPLDDSFLQDVRDPDHFLRSIVFKDEQELEITGEKVFQKKVEFRDGVNVTRQFNDVDLEGYLQKVVFLDRPINVTSKLVFDQIRLEADLTVLEQFQTRTMMGVDLDEIEESALFLNRPTYVPGKVVLKNAVFKADIDVEMLNGKDARLLISLDGNQTFSQPLKGTNVTVLDLEFENGPRINGQDLDAIYADTFMLTGDQTFTGKFVFRNHVTVDQAFDARFINDFDPKEIVLYSQKEPIIGNFEFTEPIVLDGSLRVLGPFNNMDPVRWGAIAVTDNFPTRQIVSGNWTVHGTVQFEKNVEGSQFLNGFNVRNFANDVERFHVELESQVADNQKNLSSICEDLFALRDYANKQVYRFRSFDYLRIFDYPVPVISIHQIDHQGQEYLLVNLENCHLHAYRFDGDNFTPTFQVPGFGVIDKWVTLTFDDQLHLLTLGRTGVCSRSSGNLWAYSNESLAHVHDFGEISDLKKTGEDTFLLVTRQGLEKWSSRQFSTTGDATPQSYLLLDNYEVRFVPNTDRTLLMNRTTILKYDDDTLSNVVWRNAFDTDNVIGMRVGIFGKELFLYYDHVISPNYIFIADNDFAGKRILQTIKAHKPKSFEVINFDDFVENFIVFIENGKTLQVYEYKGVDGFVQRESISMKADRLSTLRLRRRPHVAKKHCLAVIRDKRLVILEARMHGERLDMNENSCSIN